MSRATIEIKRETRARLKAAAALADKSMQDLLEEILKKELEIREHGINKNKRVNK